MQTSQGKQKAITFSNIIWNGNIVNILFTRLAITFNIHLNRIGSVMIIAVGSQRLDPGHGSVMIIAVGSQRLDPGHGSVIISAVGSQRLDPGHGSVIIIVVGSQRLDPGHGSVIISPVGSQRLAPSHYIYHTEFFLPSMYYPLLS